MNRMDDLISRQAALDITPKAKADRDYRTNNLDDAYEDGFDDALNALAEIPSAERRGRWVDGKRMGFDGTFHWFRQCSECLYEREDDTPEKDTNYCPNCGASMDEVTE